MNDFVYGIYLMLTHLAVVQGHTHELSGVEMLLLIQLKRHLDTILAWLGRLPPSGPSP